MSRVVYVPDIKSIVEGRQVLKSISWGRPPQEVTAMIDRTCPICGAGKNDPEGLHFDLARNGDGCYGLCFRCGWSF